MSSRNNLYCACFTIDYPYDTVGYYSSGHQQRSEPPCQSAAARAKAVASLPQAAPGVTCSAARCSGLRPPVSPACMSATAASSSRRTSRLPVQKALLLLYTLEAEKYTTPCSTKEAVNYTAPCSTKKAS